MKWKRMVINYILIIYYNYEYNTIYLKQGGIKMDIKKKNFITKKGYKDLNVIHYKESDGTEFWSVYDENGNIIYNKSSEGIEHFYEYDEKGNLIK